MEILKISLTSFAIFSDIAFFTETLKGAIFVIRQTGGFVLTWRGRARDWREEMCNTLLKGQAKYTDKETLKEIETCFVK